MSETTYVMLPERGLVTVSGEDRIEFLQGLISNDVTRVGPAQVIWAALLTPQGKYLHDFFAAELKGVIHLDCEADRLMDLGLSDPTDIVDAVLEVLGIPDQMDATEHAALVDYLTDHGASPVLDLFDEHTRNTKLHGLFALVMQSPAYQLH